MLGRVGIPKYQNLLSVSRQIVSFIHLMASYLFADIAFHWKIRPLTTCFLYAFSYYVCPEKSRNLRPGGQFRQLAPSRKTFWQWWQIEINHARRKIKWGVIGSLMEFAPITFSSVGWQLLWNKIWSCIFPLDTMTKGSSFKFYIWRDFQVQKQKNAKMISSQKEN